MVLTTILKVLPQALYYKASFIWWYEDTEYTLLKGFERRSVWFNVPNYLSEYSRHVLKNNV
ncbi:hypothetical protein V1477_001390 [Vespula maculifrons]|uniref:Uncharacterized protein n=1 Tax=Vespula maculifrons TaxID=7453 RepID=A0ABD2CZ60_VESMC